MTAEALERALNFLRDQNRGAPIGIAVSGGSDSVALLHLAVAAGVTVEAATVDHRLRPGAAEEARQVAALCAGLGVRHETLVWQDWDGSGNLQAAARAARRRLLEAWARERGLGRVCLGHTADDQAETFLMRLARGSGVDGLACMDADSDPLFLRPLLSERREALRDWLRARGIGWIDDPSNDDTRFDRVKARQALAALEPLGLTVERLGATAAHMARARTGLNRLAAREAAEAVRGEAGDLMIAREVFTPDAGETGTRIVAAAIRWIGGGDYRPRFDALLDAMAAVQRGETRTLGGVVMRPEGDGVRLRREAAACPAPVMVEAGARALFWDRRWVLHPPKGEAGIVPPGLTLRALGADVGQVEGWRDLGLPRDSLAVTPALFRGDRLVAAPAAGSAAGWTAGFAPGFEAAVGED